MTRRLQHRCPGFSVRALCQRSRHPAFDEAQVLQLPLRTRVLHREVYLLCHQQPAVYAQSVLPWCSLRGGWRKLGQLGNRSLGSTLFSNPQVVRTPLSYCKLRRGKGLFQAATAHLSSKPAHIWARRSVFSLQRASILVTEVFLPVVIRL